MEVPAAPMVREPEDECTAAADPTETLVAIREEKVATLDSGRD
jgi:hypothetical protein